MYFDSNVLGKYGHMEIERLFEYTNKQRHKYVKRVKFVASLWAMISTPFEGIPIFSIIQMDQSSCNRYGCERTDEVSLLFSW